MRGIQEYIKEWTQPLLDEKGLFLVDIVIPTNKQKILVLVDGDEGVNIDDCASISRRLSHQLDEEELVEGGYTLEVSSPGLEFPLKLERQYIKNIGRQVKIKTQDGSEIIGGLSAVEKDLIRIEQQENQKNKKVKGKTKTIEVPFSEIKDTFVLVTF